MAEYKLRDISKMTDTVLFPVLVVVQCGTIVKIVLLVWWWQQIKD